MLKVPPPVIGIIAAVSMWLLSKYFPVLRLQFPLQTSIAALILITGLLIDLSALWSFRKARTTINPLKPENTSSVVTTGIYQYSRNPMYLGMLLILIAVATYLGSLSSLVILPLFVMVLNVSQIVPEEKILTNLFGSAYVDYTKRVRRWI